MAEWEILEPDDPMAGLKRDRLESLMEFGEEFNLDEDILQILAAAGGYKPATEFDIWIESDDKLQDFTSLMGSMGVRTGYYRMFQEEDRYEFLITRDPDLQLGDTLHILKRFHRNGMEIDHDLFKSLEDNDLFLTHLEYSGENPGDEEIEESFHRAFGNALGYEDHFIEAYVNGNKYDNVLDVPAKREDLPALTLLEPRIPQTEEGVESAIARGKMLERFFLSIEREYGVELSDKVYSIPLSHKDPDSGEEFGTMLPLSSSDRFEHLEDPYGYLNFQKKFGETVQYIVEASENKIEARENLAKGNYEEVARYLEGISAEGVRGMIEDAPRILYQLKPDPHRINPGEQVRI